MVLVIINSSQHPGRMSCLPAKFCGSIACNEQSEVLLTGILLTEVLKSISKHGMRIKDLIYWCHLLLYTMHIAVFLKLKSSLTNSCSLYFCGGESGRGIHIGLLQSHLIICIRGSVFY